MASISKKTLTVVKRTTPTTETPVAVENTTVPVVPPATSVAPAAVEERAAHSSRPFDKALLIGINYIGSSCALRGCIYDTMAMRHYLETEIGVAAGGIKMLNEATNNAADRPTLANIVAGLAWLLAGAGPESNLLLQYSGHGSYVRDVSGDEVDGRDETWCPLDYAQRGFLIDDQIRKMVVDPLPAGCRLVIVSDSCHSGSVVDLKYSYTINYQAADLKYDLITDPLEKPAAATVICISGSRDNETSADAYIQGQYQGAMTYSLLNALGELKKNGQTATLGAVLKSMLVYLKGRGYTQNPVLSTAQPMDLNKTLLFE